MGQINGTTMLRNARATHAQGRDRLSARLCNNLLLLSCPTSSEIVIFYKRNTESRELAPSDADSLARGKTGGCIALC